MCDKSCSCVKEGEFVGVHHAEIFVFEVSKGIFGSFIAQTLITDDGRKDKEIFVVTDQEFDDMKVVAIETALACIRLFPTSLNISVMDENNEIIDSFDITEDIKQITGQGIKKVN
jgi:hypothetical protein